MLIQFNNAYLLYTRGIKLILLCSTNNGILANRNKGHEVTTFSTTISQWKHRLRSHNLFNITINQWKQRLWNHNLFNITFSQWKQRLRSHNFFIITISQWKQRLRSHNLFIIAISQGKQMLRNHNLFNITYCHWNCTRIYLGEKVLHLIVFCW